jgi:hypothetical protein
MRTHGLLYAMVVRSFTCRAGPSSFTHLQTPIFGPRLDRVTFFTLFGPRPDSTVPTCLDLAFPWPHVLATSVLFPRAPGTYPPLEMRPLGRHLSVSYAQEVFPAEGIGRDHVARRLTMALWRGR